MANIKKNDNVKVISGANKGKTGTVISVKAGKVTVSGVNVRKRHEKPSQTNKKSCLFFFLPRLLI